MGRHHRGQNECDHAGNGDGTSEGKRKFAEERAGQPTLERDRSINGGQRNRHRDDRADQFARTH